MTFRGEEKRKLKGKIKNLIFMIGNFMNQNFMDLI